MPGIKQGLWNGFDKKGYHGYKNILTDKKEDNDKNDHTETKY